MEDAIALQTSWPHLVLKSRKQVDSFFRKRKLTQFKIRRKNIVKENREKKETFTAFLSD